MPNTYLALLNAPSPVENTSFSARWPPTLQNPHFEDCVTVAHIERQQNLDLYSYDGDFDPFDQVTRLEPPPSEQNGVDVVESTQEQDSTPADTTPCRLVISANTFDE